MIVLPLVVGGLTLVASIVIFRLWLGMLPRSICPDCGEHTVAVRHPLARSVGRWVSRRWCSACEWTGWGRKGPVLWRRKGPVADGSGFRWGEDRLQADFGFQWKDLERRAGEERRAAKPQHPSGFQFADEEGETETDAEAPTHPSGFRFRAITPAEPPQADHPSGFGWKGQPPRKLRGGSGSDEGPGGGEAGGQGGGQGFRWKS